MTPTDPITDDDRLAMAREILGAEYVDETGGFDALDPGEQVCIDAAVRYKRDRDEARDSLSILLRSNAELSDEVQKRSPALQAYRQSEVDAATARADAAEARIEELERDLDTGARKALAAIDLAVRFGGIDGAHHKTWVIDQMVRALAADRYGQVVRDARAGDDGPETYEWDEGIAP